MKVNQIKVGSILSYIQMAVGAIIGIVYTPVMIRLLGKSEYGLYNTVASTVSMLSVLKLGFGSGYLKFYSIYKKDNDEEKIKRLNGMFLEIFLIISTIAFFCGMFLTNNLKLVFDEGLTSEEYNTARILMLLLTIDLTLCFPMSVIDNIIIVNERFVFNKVAGMLKTVLSPLLNLPLLLIGCKSIGVVACTLILTIISHIVQIWYALYVLKAKFSFGKFSKPLFIQLFSFTAIIAVNTLVDQINWNIDKLLLGRFKGTTSVAIYSVGYNLQVHYMQFSTAISGLFSPRVHKIVNGTAGNNKLQKEQLTNLFTKVGRIQFLILGLIAGGFVVFGSQFIKFWVGEGYGESYYVALLLMISATVPFIQNIGIEVQRAQNTHKFCAYVYCAMAVINLGLSIILCQMYGPIGSAIGTAISYLVANGVIMNIYYHKRCNIDIMAFWKSLMPLIISAVISAIIFSIIVLFIDISNIFIFVLGIVLYVIIYGVLQWFIGMNDFERDLIKKPIKKMLRWIH